MVKHKKTTNGFTLVEIILVLLIIAILVGLVIQTLVNQTNKANDARRKADLQKISIAFEEYYSDQDCYPVETILSDCGGAELKPYLNSIPCDPVYNTPYCYLPISPNKPTCYQKYRLLNTLKYLQDPVIKAQGCDSNQFCGWETECAAAGNRSGFNYGISSLNTTVANPDMPVGPTASPGPTSGPNDVWGCTKQGDTCNNYGLRNPNCPREFSSFDLCLQNCSPQSVYRCSI